MDAIPFHRPLIGPEEEEAALRALRSGWLTTGAEAAAFENEFAAFLGGGGLRCLAVNSATSGLHLALEALGVGEGDKVLVPSFTFTSTAETVRYLGADPVFVDIGADSFNINPDALESAAARLEAAGAPAKAAIPVHYGGLCCDMEKILAIARRFNFRIVEDAAHAFPASDAQGIPAGTRGDIGVFSFYATKTITTGEGGMAATRDEKIAERIAIMRSHGIDRAVFERYTDAKASWYYEVVAPGFKYNLPDVLAAIGRAQLSRAAKMREMRRSIALKYSEAFKKNPRLLVPPAELVAENSALHLYPLRIKSGGESAAGSSRRDRFIKKMKDAGIGVSVHFIPLHIMPYYRDRYRLRPEDFPESLARFRETVSLPLWPGMADEQVERVIAAAERAAEEAWQ
jgi:dTDP-4-amino-4,6-dideoxygalactose transaminase